MKPKKEKKGKKSWVLMRSPKGEDKMLQLISIATPFLPLCMRVPGPLLPRVCHGTLYQTWWTSGTTRTTGSVSLVPEIVNGDIL